PASNGERASQFGRFGVGSGAADTRTTPMRLLTRLLHSFIKTGTLELTDAHGSKFLFGAAPGPAVVARIHDSALYTRLALNPELAAAEAYMDGTLTFERGSTAHD